ncbi:hypothetical protein ACJJTC_005936 [Scirpophaga incertulas]
MSTWAGVDVAASRTAGGGGAGGGGKRKKRLADKILLQKVRDLVPESQAYMDLLAFERKLDHTILRKRLDIQEALKRPMKQKRKLRIFISNTFYPGQGDNAVASWELRVEGRLLDDSKNDPNKVWHRHTLRPGWAYTGGLPRSNTSIQKPTKKQFYRKSHNLFGECLI